MDFTVRLKVRFTFQLSLFGDTADNADLWEIDPVTKEPIPKPIKEYPIIHYRRIAEYE